MLNLLNETSNTITMVGYLIGALIMFIASALFIYLYFKCKKTDAYLRTKYQDRSLGSFKGFWGENRSRILAFLAAVFFAISVLLLLAPFAVNNTSTNSHLTLFSIYNNTIWY